LFIVFYTILIDVSLALQKDECDGMDEEDILELIPSTWEYTNAKSFLAKRVHRNNKEISPYVSHLPAGKTRKEQRKDAAARTIEDRANARAVREAADVAAGERRALQVRMAKMAMVKSQTDSISVQLCLFQDHKDHFVSKHGELKWIERVNALLDKLPDPDIHSDDGVPSLPPSTESTDTVEEDLVVGV
jgi:hypothetical protein